MYVNKTNSSTFWESPKLMIVRIDLLLFFSSLSMLTKSSALNKLTNVRLHFLSPNTTNHIQTMDAGTIQAFKVHYRKQLVRYAETEEPQTVNLREVPHMVKVALDTVTPSTISNCFWPCEYSFSFFTRRPWIWYPFEWILRRSKRSYPAQWAQTSFASAAIIRWSVKCTDEGW